MTATEAEMRCYACGGTGHKRGDVECPSAADAVHDSAPDWFKKIAPRKNGDGHKKARITS